jgi:oxalate decarboxylase
MPHFSEQADGDGDFRHRPAAEGSHGNAGETASRTGQGIGSTAWVDPGASDVVKGERSAGGADGEHPHLFHLADASANVFPGGGLQGAHEDNWPIIRGQHGAVYLARLAPGGVREPHWHPSAWELNFVLQGRVRWTLIGPGGTQDEFEASKGDWCSHLKAISTTSKMRARARTS